MLNGRWLAAAIALSFLVVVPSPSEARVVRLVIEQRNLFAGGMEWGKSGPYERLVGTAFMEVDPADPLNRVIVDLDKAPRNARGMVEFATTFFILKPVDLAKTAGRSSLPPKRAVCERNPVFRIVFEAGRQGAKPKRRWHAARRFQLS